ncbi:hypothetical protein DPMN_006323 [Dreissena polymorpha]|uniref:Uncharacterized protein n=1 Tax=Dreissena polymorpha TaxID=45954 RepID=A0A9D4MV12_DREPO|nr:hypothetical protein DPMN_006323 [Dreissena polymorpha]
MDVRRSIIVIVRVWCVGHVLTAFSDSSTLAFLQSVSGTPTAKPQSGSGGAPTASPNSGGGGSPTLIPPNGGSGSLTVSGNHTIGTTTCVVKTE